MLHFLKQTKSSLRFNYDFLMILVDDLLFKDPNPVIFPDPENCLDVYLHVDFDEAGGCDLVVEDPEGVEKEVLGVLVYPGLIYDNIVVNDISGVYISPK